MKKNVIAVMLSLVMALGGVGTAVPVFAAEEGTTAEAAVENGDEEEPEDVSGEVDSGEDTEDVGQSDSDVDGSEAADEDNAYIEDDISDDGSDQESENQNPASEPEEESVPDMDTQDADEEVVDESQDAAAKAGTIASGTCGANLTWVLDGEGKLTISGTGAMDDYDGHYEGSDYSCSSPWFGYRESVRSIDFPSGITHIGNFAFFGCSNLDEINIPESVTSLGYCMIMDTSIAKILIPKNVSSCNVYVGFAGSSQSGPLGGSNVTRVEFQNGMKTIPDNICLGGYFVSQFQKVTAPATIVENVVIPDSVTTIGTSAFGNCEKMSEIKIPSSVTTIGNAAFYSCSLSKATLEFDTEESRNGYAGLTIGNSAFLGCKLSEQNLTENAVSIGSLAFYGCRSLTEVISSAKTVGYEAFVLDSNLKTVVFNNVESLGESLFGFNSGSDSPNWPGYVSEVKFRGNAPTFDENTFSGCTLTAYYPESNRTWTKSVLQNYGGNITWVKWKPTGSLTVDPEFTCIVGEQIIISATYKGENTVRSATIEPDISDGLEFGGINIEGPVSHGDSTETNIAFTVTAKKAGEYNLTLTTDDGTSASTAVKVTGVEITLEDQTIYDDDEAYTINAEIRSSQAPTEDDLTWTLVKNNISYKNNIKEVTIEKDKKDSYLYHIKQRITLVRWGVYSVTLAYGGEKKEAELTMLHGKPLISKVESGKHRELIIDWTYGPCGVASGFEIKVADNLEFTNAVVYKMGELPCDNSYGTVKALQQTDGEDTVHRFTSKKPMRRGAKLYVQVCCMADTNEGKWSDLAEVQIGNQILSEEFFGMANSLYADNGIKDLAGADLNFIKNVFDDGVAELLYDTLITRETANGKGNGSKISFGRGICYGMDVAAIAACSYGFPSDLYGCDSLYEIDTFPKARKSHSSQTNISAEDMIRYGYFLQYADLMDEEVNTYRVSENPLLDLVNKVRACEKGTGEPPLICIVEEGKKREGLDWLCEDDPGHALVGICISEDNEDETIVEVYNPCYPGEHTEDDSSDKKQYYSIHIKKTNGEYTGWSFWNNAEYLFEGELSERGDMLNDDLLIAVDTWLHTEALKKISRGEIPFYGEQKYISWSYLHYVDQNRTFDFTDYQYKRYQEEKELTEKHSEDELADSSVNTSAARLWLTTLDEIPMCFYEEGDTVRMAQGQYYLKAIAGSRTGCTISQSSARPGYVSFTPEEDALQTAIFNGRINDINKTEQTVVQIRTPVGRTGSINENEDGTFIIEGVTFFDWKRYAGTMQGNNTIDDQTPDAAVLDDLNPDSAYTISVDEDAIIVYEDKDKDGNYDDTISVIPLNNLIPSGTCGKNVTWKLDEEGVLTISGTGDMKDYDSQSPFSSYDVKKVIIEKGVTGIGDRAFTDCSSITSVTIPETVTEIGNDAFKGCSNLTSITLPKSITELGVRVFGKNNNSIVVLTENPYVLDYCKSNGYKYYYRTAPVISKLASYNGSDIRAYIEKRENASGYQIKYADNSSMTGAKTVMIKDNKTLSKVITGFKNNKTYYVQLQTYQKIGDKTYWSRWSAAKSIKITQTPYPTNVSKLSTYIGSHIKVDWTKTAGASGYHIKYADNSKMTGAKEVMVKGNSTFTKTLTGLKNGKTYYIKIQTYRTVSGKTYWSSWSPAKSIKVDQKPYGSSIKNLTIQSSGKVKVTWDKAPGASGYHIQYYWYDKNDKRVTKDIIINGNGTLSKTITGLKENRNYYVKIQTFRKISGKTYWSSWSKEAQFRFYTYYH